MTRDSHELSRRGEAIVFGVTLALGYIDVVIHV